jgi:hypothetical protein
MKIDRSREEENASDSIRVNREFDSNVTKWNVFDARKMPFGRMRIDESNQTRTGSQKIPGPMEVLLIDPFATTIRRWELTERRVLELESIV